MTNNNTPLFEEQIKELNSAFDWADQVKGDELERWKVMYGFVPKDIEKFLRKCQSEWQEETNRTLSEIQERIRVVKYSDCDIETPNIPLEIKNYREDWNSAKDEDIEIVESFKTK